MEQQADTRTEQIIAAYANNESVASISSRFNTNRREIEAIATANGPQRPERPGGIYGRGNRILLGLAVGGVVSTFARLLGGDGRTQAAMLLVVAGVTYAVFAPRP